MEISCFDDRDRPAAEQLRPVAARTMQILQERYGIAAPADCRVYVVRTWPRMFFHAAPWPWRLYLALTYPLLALRAGRIWPLAGGWAFAFGPRQVVGIKPPDLLQMSATAAGARLFIPAASPEEKMIQVAAHELTHAATGTLRRHVWLHEGLALRVVDYVVAKPTVRPDTLALLDQPERSRAPAGRRLNVADAEAAVYTYARGYWLTRYLEDTQPALLARLLAGRRSRLELERALAAALELEPACLWQRIDGIVAAHFAPAASSS